MRFSILVPIYNVGKCIDEMLASIDAQTFRDFELVLVDDGSTDGCQDVCDDYCAANSGAKVIHKPNGGLISARRVGISHALGEYVLFVDADDMLKSNALEDINRVIEEYSSDIVIYNADIFDGNSRQPFFEHELPEGPVKDKRVIYDKLFLSYSMNSMCLKAMKRTLLDADRDYSEFYDCSVAEDLLQSVPVYIAAENIYYLDKALYDYRTDSGMTHKCNPSYYSSNRRINLDIRERLKNEGIEDLDKKAAFHILIAAYAGTTQMKYADRADNGLLESIRSDDEFQRSWDLVWNSPYAGFFSKKQKLLLKLLHDGNFGMIKLLLKIKGGK